MVFGRGSYYGVCEMGSEGGSAMVVMGWSGMSVGGRSIVPGRMDMNFGRRREYAKARWPLVSTPVMSSSSRTAEEDVGDDRVASSECCEWGSIKCFGRDRGINFLIAGEGQPKWMMTESSEAWRA